MGRSSFSQFGEDLFLANRFAGERDGFYVDVGAFHPFNWSNTCLLYQRGWRGLNIEPDPDAIRLFERYRRRDLNVQTAVAGTPGEVTFVRAGEYSGIEDEHYLSPERGGERIKVSTQPLATILEQWLPPEQEIDLLDIDCEGLDLEVLQSNDWQRFRPAVVFVEAHDRDERDQIRSFMASVGYRNVTRFHLTLVFEAWSDH